MNCSQQAGGGGSGVGKGDSHEHNIVNMKMMKELHIEYYDVREQMHHSCFGLKQVEGENEL